MFTKDNIRCTHGFYFSPNYILRTHQPGYLSHKHIDIRHLHFICYQADIKRGMRKRL